MVQRPHPPGYIEVTPQLEECLAEGGIQEGLYLANAMHITASVYISDEERGLLHDYEESLEELAPPPRSASTATIGPTGTPCPTRTRACRGQAWRAPISSATQRDLLRVTGRRVVMAVSLDGRRRHGVLVKIVGE